MLEINDLNYNIGLRTLFNDANLVVGDGQKIGLVGINGCGKTTLFRLIQKQIEPDGGSIVIKNNARIATVKQELPQTDENLLDFVLNSDAELKALNEELAHSISGERLAEIYDRLNEKGAHSAPARAGAILHGLGFANADFKRPLNTFSGGWRVRASLASTLFSPAEILLLDEPTNHLDLETSIWLENYLAKLDKTILIISHDRNILNKVTHKTAHIEDCSIRLYNGNYDVYERTYNTERETTLAAAEKHAERVAHLQSFVDRFRYKASKAKQAQSRIKMIEKMGDAPKVPPEPNVHFNFPSPELLPPYLLHIEDGSAGYEEKVVLRDLNLTISQEDRIALVGANGNGKSTLAKVLAGRLPLMSGKTTKSKKLRVAYFAQHLTEEFDLDKTAFEVMSDAMGFVPALSVRTHLGGFGLNKAKSDTLIKNLSGGEKARLCLALITKDKPHILILDEPTNHLDIVSRGALLDALNKYEGAIILITHDLHLINLVADRLLLVAEGKVSRFSGDSDDYRQRVLNGTVETEDSGAGDDKALNKRQTAAARRAEQAPLRKEIKEIDKQIEKLSEEKRELEAALIKDFSESASKQLAKTAKELSELEERWIALHERLDSV